MNADDNPYTPNAGTPPPELAGRADIVARATNTITRTKKGKAPKSFIILGLRGVGKTVLLNEFEKIAEGAGCQTAMLEVNAERSLPELLAPHLHRLLLKLDRIKLVGHGLQQAFGILWAFASAFKVTVGEVEIGVTKEKATGDLEIDLTDLFVEIGAAAAARRTAAVILMDEIQGIAKADLSALIMALHKISQKKLPLLLVGAGLPQLPKLTGDAKSYAERLFDFPNIGRLHDDDARKALVEPAKELGVTYDDDALDHILKEAGGYPFYLQVWGSHVWDAAPASPITLKDAHRSTRLAIKTLDEGIFDTRIKRLTDRQQEYARAMAELELPASSTNVAKVLGLTVREAAPIRDEVITKGIAYSPERGSIDFTVPLFDAFMRRRMPNFASRANVAAQKPKTKKRTRRDSNSRQGKLFD